MKKKKSRHCPFCCLYFGFSVGSRKGMSSSTFLANDQFSKSDGLFSGIRDEIAGMQIESGFFGNGCCLVC